MPNMLTTISGFMETIQFQLVKKSIVDHEEVESSQAPIVLWFEGHVQPLSPRELLVKPEGERKWKWWTLFTDLQLEVDSVVKDRNGIEYRVMASSDWSQAGFYSYQLTEGPGING